MTTAAEQEAESRRALFRMRLCIDDIHM
jgi:hypothetical protein